MKNMSIKKLLGLLTCSAALVLSGCGGGGGGAGGATVAPPIATPIVPAAGTYTIGGTVTGLTGSGLVLQNKNGDDLAISTSGPFTFSTPIADTLTYSVSVKTQPVNPVQACTATLVSASGTVAGANITTVAVNCSSGMGGAVQGTQLNLAPTVNTYAGAVTSVDGAGTVARFSQPSGTATDGTYLYVADSTNSIIRKVVIATGATTTLAGKGGVFGATDGTGSAARFQFPYGITYLDGFVYVTDQGNNKIRKIDVSSGVVTSLTGAPSTNVANGAIDGVGSGASFSSPAGITNDGTNLYVADSVNHSVRQVVIGTGFVSKLVGTTANTPGAVDGAFLTARFYLPYGIVYAPNQNFLYVADYGNNKIRKIDIALALVSSVTGTSDTAMAQGAIDGAGNLATFAFPSSITADGANLYVADTFNHKIRKIDIGTNAVSSLTGATSAVGMSGSVDGANAAARFYKPTGVSFDAVSNSVYVADSSNSTLRKLALGNSAVSTLAGAVHGADGIGTLAAFTNPEKITTDGTNLYVVDSGDSVIRQINIATKSVTTLAGTVGLIGATDGAGTVALFKYPSGITTDGINLYVADGGNYKIRKIVIATGIVSSFTGVADTPTAPGYTDGLSPTAKFAQPEGLTTDGINLYIADAGGNKIRKINIAMGVVSSLTGAQNAPSLTTALDGVASAATFFAPKGITTDGSNLYVADSFNNKIRKIAPSGGATLSTMDSSNAVVSSITGAASTTMAIGKMEGTGNIAEFFYPRDITTDGFNLYVTDSGSNKIRKIAPSGGATLSTMTNADSVVSSITGLTNTFGVKGAVDGAGSIASFDSPTGITTNGSSLFVSDSINGTIREIK